ncbi:hypothetical protein B0T22DRAFT_481685 [Podospora appendiculata]|uniref:Alpha-type protein kinase domain-containing protein n=1 Tax=Podospora appendiculata TaxID=314037 RepID=A0AAE1CEG2_9PEZI|nr:hypothetical protein B0T22DRAFT_481685 [Podospora appendiculata]
MTSNQSNDSFTPTRAVQFAMALRMAEARRRAQLGQPQDSASLSVSSHSPADGNFSAAARALIPLRGPPPRVMADSTAASASKPSRAVAIIPPPLRPSSISTAASAINSPTALAIIPPPLRSSLASSASTASAELVIHPAEQRRLKLIENRNLNRIDQRMEREGNLSPTAAEAEHRLAMLRREATRTHKLAVAQAPSVAGHFKNACSTDLLFVIDTTHSMAPYIQAAKNQVTSILQDLSAAFSTKLPFAPHIQCLDFTPNIGKVVTFLGSLSARGGGDEPEDVLGALQCALSTSWKNQTRCIIHITDAPAHGRTLHDLDDYEDDYAEPGSEPHRLTHPPILKQMIENSIDYTLLRINHSTDRMAYAFYQAYATCSLDCSLLASNPYAGARTRNFPFSKPGFEGWDLDSQGTRRNVKFSELELGVSYHALRKLVVQSVTSSVTNSATFNPWSIFRINPALARRGGAIGGSGLRRELSPIHSMSSPFTARRVPASTLSVELENEPPQWDSPGWLNEEIRFAAFSTEVLAHDKSMLDHMMDSSVNIHIQSTDLTVSKRDRPFSKGAMRLASYARSGVSRAELVIKTYIEEGKTLLHLVDDMCAQALCKAFALEFNAMLPEQYSLDFIVVTCLEKASEMDTDANSGQCMSLEPWIKGEYVKYNSNTGWVNEDNPDNPISQAAQAFSHFTFERSKGNFMVTDLQGVGRVLTDPALQTLDRGYLPRCAGNLSIEGFYWFFSTHECNDVCKRLGLVTTRAMIANGRYQFRENRIVRMSRARTSDDFPGYRWCRKCWEELKSTTEDVVCTAAGGQPLHQFKRSRFFYESQGQVLPRVCPKHSVSRGDDASASGVSTRSIPVPDATNICKFRDDCTKMDCRYLHPTPACPDGKNCEHAACTHRHPMKDCRYKEKCLSLACVYRHPGGHHARSGSDSPAPDCKYGARCTNTDCVYSHPVPFCPQGARCTTKDECPDRHPKQAIVCRDGANCLKTKCMYEHPPRS